MFFQKLKSYKIETYQSYDTFYKVFRFDKCEGYVHEAKKFKLKVIYTPNIPGREDVDHFDFTDQDYNAVRLILRGQSVGTLFSYNYLSFVVKIILTLKRKWSLQRK